MKRTIRLLLALFTPFLLSGCIGGMLDKAKNGMKKDLEKTMSEQVGGVSEEIKSELDSQSTSLSEHLDSIKNELSASASTELLNQLTTDLNSLKEKLDSLEGSSSVVELQAKLDEIRGVLDDVKNVGTLEYVTEHLDDLHSEIDKVADEELKKALNENIDKIEEEVKKVDLNKLADDSKEKINQYKGILTSMGSPDAINLADRLADVESWLDIAGDKDINVEANKILSDMQKEISELSAADIDELKDMMHDGVNDLEKLIQEHKDGAFSRDLDDIVDAIDKKLDGMESDDLIQEAKKAIDELTDKINSMDGETLVSDVEAQVSHLEEVLDQVKDSDQKKDIEDLIERLKEILKRNTPPVANAGENQTFDESVGHVTLDGSLSFDPNGKSLTYQWSEISDPFKSCELGDATSVKPSVTILNRASSYACSFGLIVNDGELSSESASVSIRVNAVNNTGITIPKHDFNFSPNKVPPKAPSNTSNKVPKPPKASAPIRNFQR